METYLILKGVALVIGSTATLVTAAAAFWPKKEGKVTRVLDRLSPVAPGAIYRLLTAKTMSGSNGNGKAAGK